MGRKCVLLPNGIFCFGRLDSKGADAFLNPDETINDTSIKIDGNNIVITTIDIKGELSKETVEIFAAGKIEVTNSYLSNDLVRKLFNSINLNQPKESVSFEPKQQKYEVMNITNDGKPVQIVEVIQKTKIHIDGKDYNLLMITTSAKGSGSPKQQGF